MPRISPRAVARRAALALVLLPCAPLAGAAQTPDDLGAWIAELRDVRPDPQRVAEVSDLTFTRDAGTFYLASGRLHLLEPVGGVTVGAVFVGDGIFRMDAPIPVEKAQIRRMLESDGVHERFRTAVFLFTDFTHSRLAAENGVVFEPGRPHEDAWREVEEALKYLVDDEGRIADDVAVPLADRVGGFFYAHVAADRDEPLVFEVNPLDVEEVSLYRKRPGRGEAREVVSRFHQASDFATGRSLPAEALDLVAVKGYEVEAWIDGDLDFRARATATLERTTAYRWVPFTLHPELEIQSAQWGDGTPVPYHRARESSTVWVDMVDAPAEGPVDLTLTYEGEILEQVQDLWVQVTAHRSWIPVHAFDRPVPYRVTFHTDDELRVATVGTKTHEARRGDVVTTVWETPPVRQMTFNVGEFEEHRPEDVSGRALTVQLDERAHRRLGGIAAEANVFIPGQRDMAEMVSQDLTRAFRFFDQVYGRTPVDAFIASEIPYNHGEAYPGLVLLSWATFQNTSSEGFDEMFRAHEVAHQWWGIGVRPATYRDQWLAEGFSEFSGLWYAARVNGSVDMYLKRLKETREAILRRAGKAAPLSLGPRVATADDPGDHQLMVYQKGAWVLHMLRTLLTDADTGSDELFARVVKVFYSERYGASASTAHLRAVAERETGVDLGWFFDQWVDGTAIPRYTFSYTLDDQPDGTVRARVRVRQEEVPDDFRMIVPIFLDFGDAGSATVKVDVKGPLTEVELPLLPQRPEDVVFNPFEAVLADTDTEGWKGN